VLPALLIYSVVDKICYISTTELHVWCMFHLCYYLVIILIH